MLAASSPSVMPSSLSDSSSLTKLRDGIESLRRDAVDSNHYFNPDSIRELCTPELIETAVDECPFFPEFKKGWITKSILDKGILTFCILVHIEREYVFLDLLECDVRKMLDDRLPLDKSVLESILPNGARKFFDVQWQFIPVRLPRHEHLNIGNHYVMPFITDEQCGDRAGAFGDMFKASMEVSMQDALEPARPINKGSSIVVIRKQIRFQGNDKGFKREKNCLELLQELKHPNIIELLCSYTSYRGDHNFVFPCEDMDLNDFFKLPDKYKDFASPYVFYLAMYGLILAVEEVHQSFKGDNENFLVRIGCHHDIRPHNILVRSNTFLLADFGLARMSDVGQSSTSVKGGGGEYMAPECTVKGAHIGRKADIWSLGGVFLDIAAYMQGGPQGRTDAQNDREGDGPWQDASTTHFFSDTRTLKSGVRKTIDRLQDRSMDCSLRTLAVVSQSMLKIQEGSRPDAPEVRRYMAYVSIQSLFRAALEGMIRRSERSRTSRGAGRQWEDTWKLWAWGEEIGMSGGNLAEEKFSRAWPKEKWIQDLLLKLIRLLDSGTHIEKVKQNTNRELICVENKNEAEDSVNNCVRNLRSGLPDKYESRLNDYKSHYGRFANQRPPGLPKLFNDDYESPFKL